MRTTRKRPSLYDHLRLGVELPYVSVSIDGSAEWHRIDASTNGFTACGLPFSPWRATFMRDLGIGAHRCRICMPPEKA